MSKKGPFGLWMGMSNSDIDTELIEISPYKYRVNSVPKPHSSFEFFVLQITPKSGLSWIKAVGHTISTNPFGIALQSKFDEMENKLTAIYCKHEKFDLLMPGSIWNEPRDWMSGLQNSERNLAAIWSDEYESKLTDSIHSVGLFAAAVNANEGFIGIEYSFHNKSVAEAEIAALEDDAL